MNVVIFLSVFVPVMSLLWAVFIMPYREEKQHKEYKMSAYAKFQYELDVLDYCAMLGLSVGVLWVLIGLVWLCSGFVGGVLGLFGVKVDWGSIWLFWKTFFGLK